MARPLLFNNLQAVSADFCRNRARSSLSLIAKTTIHGAFRKYTYETEIPDIWGAARQRNALNRFLIAICANAALFGHLPSVFQSLL